MRRDRKCRQYLLTNPERSVHQTSFGHRTTKGFTEYYCSASIGGIALRNRKHIGKIAIFVLFAPGVSIAAASAKFIKEDGAQTHPPNNGEVCVLFGPPPTEIQYEVLGRIVATKRTYGSTDELFDPIVREARMIGADAIINLQASQRFKGPLPWRVTSPTGDGQAIKLLPKSPKVELSSFRGKRYGGRAARCR